MMRAVLAKVGEPARVASIQHSPATSVGDLQRAVGGSLEALRLPEDLELAGVAGWMNEEGRLVNEPAWNRLVNGAPVAGDILVTGIDRQGRTVELPEEEAARAAEYLNRCPSLVTVDAAVSREAGIALPVVLTSGVHAKCVAVPPGCEGVQDEAGRLWDVLSMYRFGVVMAGREGRRGPVIPFQLHVVLSQQFLDVTPPLVTLHAVLDGEAIIIMLPEEGRS